MGIVASALFGARNIGKYAGGENPRGAVAGAQIISSADGMSNAVSSSGSIFGNATNRIGNAFKVADDAVESIFKKIGKGDALENMTKATGANTKIGAVAQKAVNPLLCVASGVRVLKDEDQYAALIEEAAAMSAMFGCEAFMKYTRNGLMSKVTAASKGVAASELSKITTVGANQNLSGLAKKAGNLLSKSGKINKYIDKASTWLSKKTGGSKGKAFLVSAAIDILFVAGSILAFNAGKKIGQKLSGRSEQQKE